MPKGANPVRVITAWRTIKFLGFIPVDNLPHACSQMCKVVKICFYVRVSKSEHLK